MESVIDFTRSCLPSKQRIMLIEAEHRPDDMGQLLGHLRILVKDLAKKLQASEERHKVQRAGGREVMRPLSKSSPPLIFYYTRTNTLYQWLNRTRPPLNTHGW